MKPRLARRILQASVFGLVCSVGACVSHAALQDASGPAKVHEVWRSEAIPDAEIDSLALWRDGKGGGLLAATGKKSDLLYILDPITGKQLRTVGVHGTELGQLRRPNGVAVAGDFLLVVERDNRRVQAFALPSCEPIFGFGKEQLLHPYGIDLYEETPGVWRVYVTDDYVRDPDVTKALPTLDRRVKVFRFHAGANPSAEFVTAFGDTTPGGALVKVETILVDAPENRVLIADEAAKSVRAYDLDGKYTGRSFGGDYIQGDPEGFGLYPNAGWLILTDQRKELTVFHIVDRKGFQRIGSFTGDPRIANTDGIRLSPGNLGPFKDAALFAVHDDQSVVAYSFADVKGALP